MNLNERELTILHNALILEEQRISRLIQHKEQLIRSNPHARVVVNGELQYQLEVVALMEKLKKG